MAPECSDLSLPALLSVSGYLIHYFPSKSSFEKINFLYLLFKVLFKCIPFLVYSFPALLHIYIFFYIDA